MPSLMGNMGSSMIAIECGCKGPNFAITSACATGGHAIGEAMRVIQNGHADRMLAGGSEAAVTPLCFAAVGAMKAMCTDCNDNPKAASRPFDRTRSGFVMGEGAGVILLERLECAEQRGAHIYAELAGYGASCDAYHITTPAPGGRGLAQAMEMAIRMSGMERTDINYINAHGTSTRYNDNWKQRQLNPYLESMCRQMSLQYPQQNPSQGIRQGQQEAKKQSSQPG